MLEKYLVYGAGGAQGGAVVQALLAQGARVRLVARDPRRSPFGGDGRVEVVAGDLDDRDSLRRACDGVTAVYLMMPLAFDYRKMLSWGRNAIDAASDSGASRLVFNTGGLVPERAVGIPMLDTKVELERYLQQARVPSVTLRGTLFMGNLGAPWSAPTIVHQGVLAYPLPEDLRVSWLSWEEAAAYAVAALARPELAAAKAVFQIGGPEALTGSELAASIARALGRPVEYARLPLAQLELGLNRQFGVPAGSQLAEYYGWLAQARQRSLLEVDLSAVRAALPVPQRSFEAWAHEFPWAMLAGAAK
jgi:uncharacterized protein YbjT (DUF2867 family)